MSASIDGYQFLRFDGFPRGAPSKRGTLGSILAEGLRKPGYISHLPGAPHIEVYRVDSPVSEASQLERWITQEMGKARNISYRDNGQSYERSIRKDALAIGTCIVSLPETMEEYSAQRFKMFSEETSEWLRDFLLPHEMMIHFRLHHLDEEHPHLHFWFTPFENHRRTGNWNLTHICSARKAFYHEIQKKFFSEIGSRYYTERAKPIDERQPRQARYIAAAKRDAAKLSGALNRSPIETPDIKVVRETLDRQYKQSIEQQRREFLQREERIKERSAQEIKSIADEKAKLMNNQLELWHRLMQSVSSNFNKASQIGKKQWLQLLAAESLEDMVSQDILDGMMGEINQSSGDSLNISKRYSGGAPASGWDEIVPS